MTTATECFLLTYASLPANAAEPYRHGPLSAGPMIRELVRPPPRPPLRRRRLRDVRRRRCNPGARGTRHRGSRGAPPKPARRLAAAQALAHGHRHRGVGLAAPPRGARAGATERG